MLEQSFNPIISEAKNITISAASQSVDITTTCNQVMVVNTSTAAIALKIGDTSGAVTAAFTDGNGLIIPPNTVSVLSKKSSQNRFAVIGLSANGTAQICPGNGV